MNKVKSFFTMLLGIFLIGLGVFMLIHDGSYIFAGKTIDLNQVLEENGEMPRDKYVTYTCYVPLGNYAETQQYYGVIPLPGKTQEYALLTENGTIISAEINKKATLSAMDDAVDKIFADLDPQPVVLTGGIKTIDSKMNGFMNEYFEGYDFAADGITVTSYAIDTTKTRLSVGSMYAFLCLIGVVVGLVSFKNLFKA